MQQLHKSESLSNIFFLAPNEQDVPLYSPYQDSIMYVEVLQQLADVVVISDDCLPKKICMECASKLVLFYKFRKKIETSQMTLSATLITTMKEEEFDDKDDMEMIEQTVEIDDQYKDESKSDDQGNDMYERDFIDLDDVIEETYTEVASDQNSINELIVENVEIEETTYTVVNKKVKKQTNHQCDECGRVFTRKTVLDQHKNTHTGIKNFSCDICSALFTRRSHLSIHMRIHENSKPYICEICSRGFRKSGDLARHRRIHFSDRNYPCSMCEKRFKRATDVTSHMRTHTKAKVNGKSIQRKWNGGIFIVFYFISLQPYKCKHPKCDKKYTSHSSLRKHEIRKHDNKPAVYQVIE